MRKHRLSISKTEVVLTGFFVCLKEQKMLTKVCTKCEVEKSVDAYSKARLGKYGVTAVCKCCVAEYNQANKEAIAEQNKAYYEANKDAVLERTKAYRQANKEKIKAYYEANKEAIAEKVKAYQLANKEAIAEQHKAYYEANKETITEYNKTYKQANKEALAEYQKAYAKANPHIVNAIKAKRRASKLRATPAWANKESIDNIYLLAAINREGGFDLHVDHIVPLRSDLVCGLHCEANLQLMLASDNISKGNRRWPDMP